MREIVETIRDKTVCAYVGGHGCDCKFGASMRGEQTGCPELYELGALLEVMSDLEWEGLQRRVQSESFAGILRAKLEEPSASQPSKGAR